MNVKSSYCRMPPKADYWKYFTVQGLLALCQIEGCPKPTVSLGSAPKNGGKKRISKSSNILASQYSSSLQLLEVWLDTWRNTMQKSGVPTARSGRGPKLRKTISRWWELQAPGLEAKGPAGTALVALAKRFCSVLCCLIFNWVLHLGTLRLQLLRPQLRGCSVRQASLWTPNGTSCVHLLLISCCSSERLTFWVCASYPGSRLFSVYILVLSCV